MTRTRRLLLAASLAVVALPAGAAAAKDNPPPVAGPVVVLADVPGWCADGTLAEGDILGWHWVTCIRAPYNRPAPAPEPVVPTMGYWDWVADVYVRIPVSECAAIPMCSGVGF